MRIYKKSLSEFILLVLEKSVDGYIRMEDFLFNPGFYAYSTWDARDLKKSDLAQAIKRLRERGFIEKEKNQERLIIKLTDLGRDALGNLPLWEKEWDGKWRIVIFDIPEKHQRVRNLFRRRLKDWGFKIWQRSVWISKNNVADRLRNLIKKLDIEDWVAVIESDDPVLKNIL